jgi:hypothetical protein
VLNSFLARLSGALGTVGGIGIRAPAPTGDSFESPIMLNAMTLALTYAPVVRLNGEARKIKAGIVQDRLEITDELLTASQFAVSCCHVLEEVSM